MSNAKAYWCAVANAAAGLGVSTTGLTSWEDLARRVIKAMNTPCIVCSKPARALGVWFPADDILGGKGKHAVYTICNLKRHSTEEVERVLVARAGVS